MVSCRREYLRGGFATCQRTITSETFVCRRRGSGTWESLPANLLDHLHNRVHRCLWLVELNVVSALLGKELLAVRRQAEEIGLLAIPVQIPIRST